MKCDISASPVGFRIRAHLSNQRVNGQKELLNLQLTVQDFLRLLVKAATPLLLLGNSSANRSLLIQLACNICIKIVE